MKKRHKTVARRSGAKRSKSKGKSYDWQTGRLTGRAVGAQERLDDLAEKYQAAGMPPEEARQRARSEMRSNPHRDWRKG
jgi:hypothetical protein